MSWMELGVAALTGGTIKGVFDYLTRKRRDARRDAKRFDEITLAVYERVAAAQKELMANLQREVSELRVQLLEVQSANASLMLRIQDLEERNQKLSRENSKLQRRVKELERELPKHVPAEGGAVDG